MQSQPWIAGLLLCLCGCPDTVPGPTDVWAATDAALTDGRGLDAGPRDARLVDGGQPDVTAPDGGATDRPAADAGGPERALCPPLPAATGTVVEVTPGQVGSLRDLVASAPSGTTLLLHDGTYDLSDNAQGLIFATAGVTLRSHSGHADAVILDGRYVTRELVSIAAANVTIAELTLQRAYDHPIHVTGRSDADITAVHLYGVRVIDPGQQAIKINPSYERFFADQGRVECSHIELTAAGRAQVRDNCYTGGIDAHAARGWVVRRNTITGFWCASGLAEHGVHFWHSSRGTLIEQNLIHDCARGIGLGLGETGAANERVYSDNPYAGAGFLGHIDGIVRNNFISATIAGVDTGISLDQVRGAQVMHNTVVALQPPFNSIEWRWANTQVHVFNNLVSHQLMARNGAVAYVDTNVEAAPLSLFQGPASGDLHLVAAQAYGTVIGQGAPLAAGVCDDDVDGQTRSTYPDIGADEHVP